MADNHGFLEPLLVEEGLDRPFIVAGDRAYLIGHQDGSFPDMGTHVAGEMGGIWAHPIKLLDGLWLRVDGTWLTAADRFRVGPWWAEQEYELDGLRIVRHAFVPDGEPAVVIRYTFHVSDSRLLLMRSLARADLRSVWGQSPVAVDGSRIRASFEAGEGAWWCRDYSNSWNVVIGARNAPPVDHICGDHLWGPEETAGRGPSVVLDFEMHVQKDELGVLELVIAGSHQGSAEAFASYRHVCERLPELSRATEDRVQAMLARSALEIPEPAIERAWDWIKCDYAWLVRAVPALGRGLGAGVPEYPWWFGCDNGYALRGCLALGQHDIAIDTLDLLRRLSIAANKDSGRVIHEANTWGIATNLGNTQETPHFTRAVWDTFLWTGDVTFLARNYSFCKRGILDWTLGERCCDGDPLPYGYGVMEMAGLDLQCIDTASLTVEALDALAGMAQLLDEPNVSLRCRALRDRVRRRLEEAFWMEDEGLYGDMLGTPSEMAPRLQIWMESAAGRNPQAAEGFRRLQREAESDPDQSRKRPWSLKNWSVLSPLEAGLTDPQRASRTLRRSEGEEFTGPWGGYVNGIERDAMMSIATGVMATAEVTYGRVEQAFAYVRTLTDQLGMQMPGAISEMSPDYGCFVQAWSGYGVAWPVITGIFGLRPDAYHRQIDLTPSFPAGWSHAQLRRVQVGTNSIDLHWDGARLWVTSREPGWRVTCDSLPLQPAPDSVPFEMNEPSARIPGA